MHLVYTIYLSKQMNKGQIQDSCCQPLGQILPLPDHLEIGTEYEASKIFILVS